MSAVIVTKFLAEKKILQIKRTMHNWLTKNRLTIFSILIIVPFGFASKFYRGTAAGWVNNSLGGVFYEIFWCLALYLFFSKMAIWKNVVIVLTATCLLEAPQLWHPPFLEMIRATFIGRTTIGNSFVISDFFYYIGGCGFGWIWLILLEKNIHRRGAEDAK